MIELALHQPVHDVQQGGVDPEPREADGGLQPEIDGLFQPGASTHKESK